MRPMKHPCSLFTAVAALTVSLPAAAIIFDCDLNADGTYTCVELQGLDVPETTREEAREMQRKYIEQARTQCEYREPRRAMGGRQKSAAHWMEDKKKARKDYEDCIADKANELQRTDQQTGQ